VDPKRLPPLKQHAANAQVITDDALAAFVIINAALQLLRCCCDCDADACSWMKNYRVGMGFGLHAGCASVRLQ
jgi:hypothetical protein